MGAEPPPTEVLLADQRRRWARGECVPVEYFLQQRPGLKDKTELVLDLIYGEVLLRKEAGQQPNVTEYLARFPELADPIRMQFEVDDALAGTPTRLDLGNPTESALPRDGTAPPTPPGYEVLNELGRGGMGVVYLAKQRGLDRLVALKVIRSGELADPGERARFDAEARAAARLSHPNVVQVYEVGSHDGRPFLAMEHVPGGTLADALTGPPMPPRAAATLAATLARAVDHAHANDVVHRDLKPANILLKNAQGRKPNDDKRAGSAFGVQYATFQPKIGDFGLAKQIGADGLTRTGDFVGTPTYAAPEQTVGKNVGPAADVWALGAILYQMLTGRPPFVGDGPVEIIDQVRFADPVPPSRLRPKMPRDLETITLACLRKDPAKRYKSAAALADDLERFLDGQAIKARPVSNAEKVTKWCRRRPALASSLAALAVLTAASLITVTALWQRAVRSRDAEETARLQEETARSQEAMARTAERTERERAEARGAELLIANARYAWTTDDLPAARKALDEVPPAYRTADWANLNRATTAGHEIVAPARTALETIAVSPDGRQVAVGALEWIRVFDTATGKPLATVFAQGRTVTSLAFAADGTLVAAGQHYDLHGKPPKPVVNEVFTVDPAAAQFRPAWELPERTVTMVVAPNGERMLWTGAGQKGAALVEGATGRRVGEAEIGQITRVAFSPSGRRLLIGELLRDLSLWDPATGRQVGRLHTPVDFAGAQALAVSDDGPWVVHAASISARANVVLLVYDPAGTIKRIDSQWPQVTGVALTADGRRCLAHGGDSVIRVWELAAPKDPVILRGVPSTVRCATFLPDGRHIVAGYKDGRVVVWDAGE